MLKKKLFWTLTMNLILVLSFFHLNAQDKEDEVIKVNTSLVNIPVIVSDRNGRNIAGLKVENFNVFHGVIRNITCY